MVTTAALDAITTGYSVKFRDGLSRITGSLPWQLFADEVTSDDATTVYPIKGHAARMREWVGERLLRQAQIYGYTLTNRKFEDTVRVKVTDIEDDKYGLYNSQMTDLGEAAARLPMDEIAAAILAGDATDCYDGEFYFDTDHPQDPFGSVTTTWSNDLATTALTAANVNTTRTAMRRLVDEFGNVLGISPTHLIVPATLQLTAEEICGPNSVITGREITAATTASAISNALAGSLKVIVLPELDADSTTVWYMADLGKMVKPLFWQWRVRPQFQRITSPDSEYVLTNDAYVFGARARGAAGYALPHLMFRCAA